MASRNGADEPLSSKPILSGCILAPMLIRSKSIGQKQLVLPQVNLP